VVGTLEATDDFLSMTRLSAIHRSPNKEVKNMRMEAVITASYILLKIIYPAILVSTAVNGKAINQ